MSDTDNTKLSINPVNVFKRSILLQNVLMKRWTNMPIPNVFIKMLDKYLTGLNSLTYADNILVLINNPNIKAIMFII